MLKVNGKNYSIPDDQIEVYKEYFKTKMMELQNEYNKKLEEAKQIYSEVEEYMNLCNAIEAEIKDEDISQRM